MGFAIGRVSEHGRTTFVTPAGQQVPGGLPGRDGDGGFFNRGFANGGLAIGRVASVSGSSFTMQTVRGTTVTVKTTKSTTVNGTAGGNLSGLSVGQVVWVRGTQNSDGSISASAVLTRAAGVDDGQPGAAGSA